MVCPPLLSNIIDRSPNDAKYQRMRKRENTNKKRNCRLRLEEGSCMLVRRKHRVRNLLCLKLKSSTFRMKLQVAETQPPTVGYLDNLFARSRTAIR